jgi:hypothetical protein
MRDPFPTQTYLITNCSTSVSWSLRSRAAPSAPPPTHRGLVIPSDPAALLNAGLHRVQRLRIHSPQPGSGTRGCHLFRIQLFLFRIQPFLQFSHQFRQHLFRIPSHQAPRLRPLRCRFILSFQNCYASRSISCSTVIAAWSALITGSLAPSAIGDVLVILVYRL